MEKMDAHVQLLVGTLETVAKELIEVCKDANLRYYEYVKPSLVYSEPPTPLAAPLPEYFIFETSDRQKDAAISQIGELESSRKKTILSKLLKLQVDHTGELLTPQQEEKIKAMLQQCDLSLDMNLLNQVFTESKTRLTDRERLAYEMIHSRHDTETEMVTLNDLLEETPDKIDKDVSIVLPQPETYREEEQSE